MRKTESVSSATEPGAGEVYRKTSTSELVATPLMNSSKVRVTSDTKQQSET